MKSRLRLLSTSWTLVRETFSEWIGDKAPRLGAALAYYTLFSLAPLLIIAIALAGLVFGQEAVRGEVVHQVEGLVGTQGGQAIQAMIENASKPTSGFLATLASVALLIFGASGVFAQLQDALNTVWEVKPKEGRGIIGILKDRLLSFTMILVIGFLLLVSLLLSAFIAGVSNFIGEHWEGLAVLWQATNFLASFFISTLLFALIFKVLPDAKVHWGDVWVGALITSFLFSVGRLGIGLYLGHSSIASVYGAAGSVVVILIWAYYASQILLFGAEFTEVYARHHGSRVVPSENAEPISEAERNHQGLAKA